ncbi:hypothetical protein JL722_13001 [Aureococcus anophagefferens]|nr:hypothetical protein JL722_13001 [Aureococcus anophagefferens]
MGSHAEEISPLVASASWGTLSEGLRDGDGAPDVAKAKALDAPPAPWGRRERLRGLASVALLAILSKIAGNALIYLYAAGEVKTGARHAVQTACGVSDVDFAILVGYCPGAATVLAGLALSLVRPLPADASALRDAALAGALASGLGLAGLALAESVAALFAAQFAIGCGFTLVTVAATTFVGATLNATCLVPVALAGPFLGGLLADHLARSGRDVLGDQALAACLCSAAATAACLLLGDFGAAQAALFGAILCDGFAMAPQYADDLLELGVGLADERNGDLGLDIGLALAACYAAALGAAGLRVARAARKAPGA